MSVYITSKIWMFVPYDGSELLVMLAIGDFSDDDGWCFPDFETLAKKARVSTKSVQRLVLKAEADGYLECTRGKHHVKTEFTVLHRNFPTDPPVLKSDNLSTLDKVQTGHLVPPNRTSGPSKVDKCGGAIRKIRHEPSENHQDQPKPSALPVWIPKEAWDGYMDVRKRMKIPTPPRSVTMLVNKLEQFRSEGHDPAALLDAAAVAGWRSVFPPRENGNGRRAAAPQLNLSHEAEFYENLERKKAKGDGYGL